MIIGQKDLLDKIQKQIDEELFPRFSIFVGASGSGKKTIMRYIAKTKMRMAVYELEDVKVDTVRKMIDDSYKVATPTVYIMADAQNMSLAAKNAILKITEEPPNKAYFMISTTSLEELLDTIKSRGTTYYMRPYSLEEKEQYLDAKKKRLDDYNRDLILEVSNTLHDIDKLLKSNPGDMYDYIDYVLDNVADINMAHVLKLPQKIAFKEEDDKFDLMLFWKMCCYNLKNRLDEDMDHAKMYADMISCTVRKMSEVHTPSVSKSNTYDMWLLDLRKIIKKYKVDES